MAEEKLALFSADTDRVKEYVFESAKLPEIRGASMLLDELNWGYDGQGQLPLALAEKTIGDIFLENDLSLEHWPAGNLVYFGGGSLLAVVPERLAPLLAEQIQKLYPEQTGLASITCVWRPVDESELEHGAKGFGAEELAVLQKKLPTADWQRVAAYYTAKGALDFGDRHHFGELVRLNGLALRRAKDMRRDRPFYEALPHAVRCASCQVRPASQEMDEGQFFCDPCSRKRCRPGELPGERRYVKSLWLRRFEDHLLKCHPDLAARYYQGIPQEKWQEAEKRKDFLRAPQDLEAIGNRCHRPRSGFVGFFYADGNDLGSLLNGEGREPQEYIRISQQIKKALEMAVFEALAGQLQPYSEGSGDDRIWIHPFEILTIGGDDVLLIVPGDVALPIAGEICRIFEERVNEPPLSRHVTLSAGLVIADQHNPIYFLHDLAEDLLRSAKRKAKSSSVKQGTVDFLVLKSQSMLETDLESLRHSPAYTAGNGDLLLTCRPYTWRELREQLWDVACKLREYPRSQVYALSEALHQGQLVGSVFYLYQWARDTDKHKEVLESIGKAWDVDARTDPWPWLEVRADRQEWIDAEYRYRTPLVDFAEVLDFVPHTRR